MSENVEGPKDGVSIREEWKWDENLSLCIGSCYNLKEAESVTKGSSKQCVQQGGDGDMFGQEEENGSDCTTEDIPSSVGKRSGSGVNQMKRSGKVEAMASRYKGVVPQPKGRWGAQIYEKHRRIWLGTFNTEQDAAHSYDTAALKFRGRKAITNFAPVEDSDHQEILFLLLHSKAEIVDMLRKHTYNQELQQSYTNNNAAAKRSTNSYGEFALESERATFPREHLFDKTVTPSDVGKLNRLVIPKHHAQRCFPMDSARTEKGIMLNFQDSSGRTWRFRYSYWNSSQSYVLTKGWSGYVKEKELRTGDTVTFERSTGDCGDLYISFCRRPCNIVPQNSISIARFLPGYSRWTQTSVPAEDNRALIYSDHIPWSAMVPFAFPSCFGSCIPLRSPSLSRKCNALRYSNLSARTCTQSISPVSSSVTLFGVNLSPSSSSTLNLFPSSLADNGGPSSIEAAHQ